MALLTKQKWIEKYSELSHIIEDGLGVPQRNKFAENYFINSESYQLLLKPEVRKLQSFGNDEKIIKDLSTYSINAPSMSNICGYVEKLVNESVYCDFHKKKVGFTGLQ